MIVDNKFNKDLILNESNLVSKIKFQIEIIKI